MRLTNILTISNISLYDKVDACFKENDRLKNCICALEESVKLYEVECKASRETVKRLATDVEHEQSLSASRANELNSSRQVSYRSMMQLNTILEINQQK